MTSQLVLVANAGDSTVTAFRFDPTAEHPTLERLGVQPVGRGCGTFVLDEQRDLLYAGAKADDEGRGQGIDVFRLDRATGSLARVGHHEAPASLTYLDLAHDGRYLLGASYGGGWCAVYPLDGDGGIGEATALVEWPQAHCVIAGEGGAHVHLVSLGADVIAQYALDAADGALTSLGPAVVEAPPGSGPRHLMLADDGTRAYLVTEFSGEVLAYRRDPATGGLEQSGVQPIFAPDAGLAHSELGADPIEGHLIWGADVWPARAGSVVLASERCQSTLAALPVAADGTLGAVVSLIGTVRQPRGFCVTLDGEHAVVAGERDTDVALVAIGPDGILTEIGRHPTGAGANWVRAYPMP